VTDQHIGGADDHGALDITKVSADAPQMQPLARNPESMERWIALLFIVGMVCFVGFIVAYWQNLAYWTYGAFLGGGMAALGVGLVAWGKYLMPRGPFVEDRHPLASSADERSALAAALVERGGGTVKRRKVLGALLGGGLGLSGLAILVPFVRSLGPLPGDTLAQTDWKAGLHLVDINGRRIHRDDLALNGALTVYPEGFEHTDNGTAVDQTMLIALPQGQNMPRPGRAGWTVDGTYTGVTLIAYSKLCTHLGCPVGLYETKLQALVCPCHQSMFNVLDGAEPTFGPAPRPLPQLPIATDAEGYLIAQAGYDQPVGPGYWERP